jgi:putative oxidoreductase
VLLLFFISAMINSMNKLSRTCHNPALGLLLIRIATGAIFIHHGWMKYGNVPMTTKFIQSLGMPGFMAYAIIAVEIIGGAMLILGVLGRVAAVATGIAMIVAVSLVTYPHRGLAGSELELLLMAVSFGLALTSMGKYRLLRVFEH